MAVLWGAFYLSCFDALVGFLQLFHYTLQNHVRKTSSVGSDLNSQLSRREGRGSLPLSAAGSESWLGASPWDGQ